MTNMTKVGVGSSLDATGIYLKRTARSTGLLHLGFFVTGILGSMVVPGQLFVADHPRGALSNLVQHARPRSWPPAWCRSAWK